LMIIITTLHSEWRVGNLLKICAWLWHLVRILRKWRVANGWMDFTKFPHSSKMKGCEWGEWKSGLAKFPFSKMKGCEWSDWMDFEWMDLVKFEWMDHQKIRVANGVLE